MWIRLECTVGRDIHGGYEWAESSSEEDIDIAKIKFMRWADLHGSSDLVSYKELPKGLPDDIIEEKMRDSLSHISRANRIISEETANLKLIHSK